MTESPEVKKRPKARWKRVLLQLLAVYGGLLLVLTLIQSKLLYFPTKAHDYDPKSLGFDHRDVQLKASDGTSLHGWWFPHKEARLTLLICHGNAGNISHRLFLARMFLKQKWQVFLFDYRGYGKSEGSPSEEGTYLDVRAAWDYLVGELKLPPEQIVVMGRSMGGPIAAHLATQVQPGALILDSTFSSFVDVGQAHFPWLPVRWIARFSYDTHGYIQKRKVGPLLIIHSPQDEVIPYRLGQKNFRDAPQPKSFLEIRGSHNDGILVSERDYIQGVEVFFQKHLRHLKKG